ncbi:glycosyltransferase [Methylotetracoccus oryzae]|uniref:glycosyltransferase n=1 Tax=Methylotetracoccus oryzae TaxID=1919059 RepID=UPI001118C751|nr:glycosyltransferase family 2 protein [Methylotetracoccus oryzae]
MLSAIIPTRDRANFLALCLDSINAQTLPVEQFEVLVVDNGSTDDTKQVVESFRRRCPNVRYIYDATPGLHVGRHRGMNAARGDVLVFADDDIEAFPTWLAAIDDAFSDPKVALVGGNNLPKFVGAPPDWLLELWAEPGHIGGRCLASLSILELPEGVREIDPMYVWGCNFAIRKEVLMKAGGFHPDGMPRELIRFRGDGESHVSRWISKQGLKCMFHSGASVYHKVTSERMTLRYFHQRGFNQGISDSYTKLRSRSAQVWITTRLPYQVARWAWRKVKAASKQAQINAATDALRSGYREGFSFHQDAYRADPEVREWVHRKQYY